MSFTNVPVTRTLVFGLISSSVLVSLFDVKHNFFILVDDHIWRYGQYWRALTYQLCCTNSTEALFACLTLYNMRVVERVWGSRKYAVSLPLLTGVWEKQERLLTRPI
jgi:membrane associated rhomboid family serine protease